RVGVVEHDADIAQPADAGFRAYGRDTDLHPRIAERAFLGFTGFVVEVDLLVWAGGHALPPAATFVLVHQDDAVFGAFVDRSGGARRRARRVQAVFADSRQVEHEGLFEFELHLLGDPCQQRILTDLFRPGPQIVVPVRTPGDLRIRAGDQRFRPGNRCGVDGRGGQQIVVFVAPGLVIVLDGR